MNVKLIKAIFLCSAFLTVSCSNYQFQGKSISAANYCDLPLLEGDTVVVSTYYSGIEEYWGLYSKACDLKAELNIDSMHIHNQQAIEILNDVHSEYFKYQLKVKALGYYRSSEEGAGHLGHNDGDFFVIEFLKLNKVKNEIGQ